MSGQKIALPGVLELTGEPQLRTLRDVLLFVERDCDAEGFTFRRGRLVALRFFADGTPYPVKEYDFGVVVQ